MHIIRLRGPWLVGAIARFVPQADGTYLPVDDGLPAAAQATMPADWSAILGGDFLGRVRYLRTFNKPTGLESGERVYLVVESARSSACVTWKRELLGFVRPGESAARFEITALL